MRVRVRVRVRVPHRKLVLGDENAFVRIPRQERGLLRAVCVCVCVCVCVYVCVMVCVCCE